MGTRYMVRQMKPDIDEIIEHTIEVSENNDISVDKIILFGSIMTDDFTDDIDIILVSLDFESIDYHQRTVTNKFILL